mmetsp:Transcript_11448/g.21639  ORF Transcript_11448/g.21639 Transcript_11448/m.21639 type:complete len:472 (-) Transcript_11448:254-1669(-)
MWSRALLSLLAAFVCTHGQQCQRGRNNCNSGPSFLQHASRVKQAPAVLAPSSEKIPVEDGVSTAASAPVSAASASCAPYEDWPDVDGGVTCGGCRALVLTAPYGGKCSMYCANFSHTCVAAAEEKDDTCDELETKGCDQAIEGTSDMLCTCHSATEVCYDGLGGLAEDEGNEIGKIETSSLEECESSCSGNAACKSLTFCQPWGSCFLKDRSFTGNEPSEKHEHCRTYFKKPCGSAPTSPPPWSGGGGGGSGQSMQVKVVSYNLYWWNAFDQNRWKSENVLNNIKNNLVPDTIGFQECDDPNWIHDATGLESASPFQGAQGVMVKSGLFNIISRGSRDLQATGKWGPRYVTWVELQHVQSGRSFFHFNTHWCVHSGNGRHCDANVRYGGAKNMLAAIQEQAGDAPVVITGDFNAELGEAGPQHFLQNGFKLAQNKWVDCIFYSHHWELVDHGFGDYAGSDHQPVYAFFELK